MRVRGAIAVITPLAPGAALNTSLLAGHAHRGGLPRLGITSEPTRVPSGRLCPPGHAPADMVADYRTLRPSPGPPGLRLVI